VSAGPAVQQRSLESQQVTVYSGDRRRRRLARGDLSAGPADIRSEVRRDPENTLQAELLDPLEEIFGAMYELTTVGLWVGHCPRSAYN
jgi:hypothetical protein